MKNGGSLFALRATRLTADFGANIDRPSTRRQNVAEGLVTERNGRGDDPSAALEVRKANHAGADDAIGIVDVHKHDIASIAGLENGAVDDVSVFVDQRRIGHAAEGREIPDIDAEVRLAVVDQRQFAADIILELSFCHAARLDLAGPDHASGFRHHTVEVCRGEVEDTDLDHSEEKGKKGNGKQGELDRRRAAVGTGEAAPAVSREVCSPGLSLMLLAHGLPRAEMPLWRNLLDTV